jgi:hypothetical protein
MANIGKRPLMGTDNILELQDNGYKSTVSAIAEIIDNSIQAGSTKVEIVIIKNTTREHNEIEEIIISDNGSGMDKPTFDKALQMSSGTRSKATSGLGKYGQGLPNSSISQTKRVEVYTFQNEKLMYNHIDLNEIFESGQAYLPDTEEVSFIDIPIYNQHILKIEEHGTIVRWVHPNRINPKTARTLKDHINKIGGRLFRHFISGFKTKDNKLIKTDISISVYDFNGINYSKNEFLSIDSIKPFDPMFLMKNTQMNELFGESNHPTSVLFDEPLRKTFTVDYNGKSIETNVEIRLSYCKAEERQRYGRNAGSTEFGKVYLRRNMTGTSGYNNISIVREGREIDCGNYGFISDVSDQRERWWSAEVWVEPIIDSIIGIDNKKQQASNIRSMDSEELSDPEVNEILKWISRWLDENIKNVKSIINAQNAGILTEGNLGATVMGLPPGGESEPGNPGTEEELNEAELNVVKIEFIQWVSQRYPSMNSDEVEGIVDHALSIRDNHIFIKSDLGDTQLYSYKVFGTKVLIEINYNHSFYRRFMQKFEEGGSSDKSLRSIRLMIGSMVNGEIQNATQDKELLKDRRNVKNRMFESLDDYIEDLYSN